MRRSIVSTLGGLEVLTIEIPRPVSSLLASLFLLGCSASPYSYKTRYPRVLSVSYPDENRGAAVLIIPSNVWLQFHDAERTFRVSCRGRQLLSGCPAVPMGSGPLAFEVQAGTRAMRGAIEGGNREESWRAPFEKDFQFRAGLAYRFTVEEGRESVEFEIEPLPLAKYIRLYPESPLPRTQDDARPRHHEPPNQQ